MSSVMMWGGGAAPFYSYVYCTHFDVRGSNPLGLNCSSALEFCKGMGFKKRSFLCTLLLLLKDSNS